MVDHQQVKDINRKLFVRLKPISSNLEGEESAESASWKLSGLRPIDIQEFPAKDVFEPQRRISPCYVKSS